MPVKLGKLYADQGRVLMQCSEKSRADREGRKPRKLLDSDYLLDVYDEIRTGVIRFSLADGGPFLSDDKETTVPHWAVPDRKQRCWQ